MTKTSITRIILLLLVFSLFLTACGFQDEYSEDFEDSRPPLNQVSEEVETDESADPLENISGYNYEGKSFVIVTTDGSYFKSTSAETLIDKGVSLRNEAVDKKFNINIEVKIETADEIYENAKNAASKGTHYADLIVAPANVLSKLMNEKLLLNLNILPFIDRKGDYFNEALYSSAELNRKTYMLFGELTQTDYSAWCVFYNQVLATRTGIDPYELYKKGEWTWEAFLEYAKKTSQIVKSGFVSTADKDELITALWASTGNKFFGDSSKKPLSLPALKNGKSILSEIRKLLTGGVYGTATGSDAVDAFVTGKSGMILCSRNNVYSISESGMDWKAVPMPKFNADSSHHGYVGAEALAVSVPNTVEDSDFVGRVLNALMAATPVYVTDNVEKNELYYYWKDNTTAICMGETLKHTYIDIGIIYAKDIKAFATVTTENILASYEAGISPFQFYHSTQRQFQLFVDEYFG